MASGISKVPIALEPASCAALAGGIRRWLEGVVPSEVTEPEYKHLYVLQDDVHRRDIGPVRSVPPVAPDALF